jgi:acid phosphatase (class A)
MKPHHWLSLCAVLALTSATAAARDPSFVSAAQSGSGLILASPPANDSDVTRRELAELHSLEASRSEQQSAQAIWDDNNEHIFIYKTVFGDGFNAEKLPTVAAFGKRVRNDEGINSDVPKQAFHRQRPYNLDKTLKPICATKVIDDSYPSGHATSGYLLALAVIDLVPERRDDILARAENYAFNRLICGVHYRSDVEASKLLAFTVHAIMKQNPQYQLEMAAARAELRNSLSLK